MKKQVNKILPDGKPSGLSLNQFKVYRNENSRWNGLKGEEIYSIELFKMKFFEIYPEYKLISDFDVLKFIQNNYKTDIKIWNIIEDVVDGLANIILSLYNRNEECTKCNENLWESDWEFWRRCKHIILDGKIMSGNLGNEIVELLSSKIKENLINIKIYKLSDFVDVDTPSLLGCSYGNNYEKQYVFDFGNSAVKRGLAIRNNKKIEIREKDSICHENFWEFPDCIESAIYVDNFISNIILQTISEFNDKLEETINISLCLANNVLHNKIANRGSYRFLRLLNDNYEEHLSKRLSKELKKEINVCIYNDAEAVGRIFLDFSPDTAIITLGTLLGIAYPPYKA